MRRLIAMWLLFPAAVLAAPQPTYQPLAFLVGHCWKGTMPGGKSTDEHCFTWVYDGKFVRDQHTVHGTGHADSLGESIYWWNSAEKRIEYLYIESDGGFSRGPVATDQDALVFPPTSYLEDGKTETYRSRWQRSGEKAYDVVTEFEQQGKWVAGFKVHMEQTAGR
jgi:hypothetical protein